MAHSDGPATASTQASARVKLRAVGIIALLALVAGILLMTPSGAWFASPLLRPQRIGVWLNTYADVLASGMAFVIAFRIRHLPIGAEASTVLGGFAAWFVAAFVPLPPVARATLAIGVGLCAGAVTLACAGWLKTRYRANEVLVTLMLVRIAPLLASLLYAPLFALATGIATRTFGLPTQFAGLPRIGTVFGPALDFGTLHPGAALSIAACIVTLIALERGRFGYAARMTGASTAFAHYGGIDVDRTVLAAYALIGALMALPGLYRSLAGLQEPLVAAPLLAIHGIVIAVLARGHAWRVVPIALGYAYLLVLSDLTGISGGVGQDVLLIVGALTVLGMGVRSGAVLRR